jgi:hypothetical protein
MYLIFIKHIQKYLHNGRKNFRRKSSGNLYYNTNANVHIWITMEDEHDDEGNWLGWFLIFILILSII